MIGSDVERGGEETLGARRSRDMEVGGERVEGSELITVLHDNDYR